MRIVLIACFAAFLVEPALAQTAEERAMIVDGWARGEWRDIHTAARESPAHEWVTPPAEELPWTSWSVKKHSEFIVQGTTAFGDVWYAEFLDGKYRDFDSFDGEDRVNARDLDIVEYAVHAPDEWFLIYRRSQPENYYSELTVMGDLFIWSNFYEDENGKRWRNLISISRLASGKESVAAPE